MKPNYDRSMKDLRELLAINLKTLMSLSPDCKSQLALSRRSKVAQTTIGNYINQSYPGYPNLEKVEMLAHAFGLEAWNLLHHTMGNTEISTQEIALYRRMRKTFNEMGVKLPIPEIEDIPPEIETTRREKDRRTR